MLVPMLPTLDPYTAAERFQACGWHVDYATDPASSDRMAIVSLEDNTVMLGVAEPPFVTPEALPHLGAGTAFNCTVPAALIEQVHTAHRPGNPTPLTRQPWGPLGFHVRFEGFLFMIVTAD